MTLSQDLLTNALQPRPVRFIEKVGSTNDLALAWLADGAPTGGVVITEEQTKGRGRLGRSWFAPTETALLFSVILRTESNVLSRIPMLGALAVCAALEDLGIQKVGIKWPNDVQIDRRKVCGILPEAAWNGNGFAGVVLGIGVNVRVDFSESPFKDTAISVETVLGRSVDRHLLLKRILDSVDELVPTMGSDPFFERWRDKLNMLGHFVTFEGKRFLAEDIDQDGALVIRDEAGKLQRAIAGDIALG
jgi:BirA family biotin operon repressor/biotin-[acetyl-CoA-carboxylase] ligase